MKPKVLQVWEGVINGFNKHGDRVCVSLVDVTAGDTVANETAELSVSDFLKPGQIFRWTISVDDIGETRSNITFAPFQEENKTK